MHDFRRGTYHLEVWDGSRIRSEDFRVTGWTENPLYEVYQFFYNVFGRNPYKITALLVDWASTSPSQYSFLYLIAGGILCMYVIGIFLFCYLGYLVWENKEELGRLKTSKGFIWLLISLYLIGDGLFSILIYYSQTLIEHVPRIN